MLHATIIQSSVVKIAYTQTQAFFDKQRKCVRMQRICSNDQMFCTVLVCLRFIDF